MPEENKPPKKQISRDDWSKPVRFTPPSAAELRERIKNLRGWFPDAINAMRDEIAFQLNREA